MRNRYLVVAHWVFLSQIYRKFKRMFEEFGLSKREGEIVRLKMEGMTNKRIADELEISISTVKTHLWLVYQRYGCSNATHLCCKILMSEGINAKVH